MKLEFSTHIEGDLDSIAAFIADDNPARALTFIQDIRSRFEMIANHPFSYQPRPEIGPQARLAVVGNYVILFRVLDAVVRVERVVYGGRDLAALA